LRIRRRERRGATLSARSVRMEPSPPPPLHRQFILTNPLVFEAKEMALEGEIAKIDVFIEKLLANLKKYPMKLKSSPAQMMSLGSMLVRNSKILRSVSSLPVLEPVHVHPPYVHTFMLYALKLVWAG
jgi:hypothetical protein